MARFRLPFRSRRVIEREVADEFAFHIEQRTEELVGAGLVPAQARAQAEQEFGDRRDAERYCVAQDAGGERTRRRADWLADAALDVKLALRQLRLRPAFAIAAALTLALGIGATSAIFALVDRVVLRPLPYPDAGRLVALFQVDEGESNASPQITYADFTEIRAAGIGLERMALVMTTGLTVSGDGMAARIMGRQVTGELFAITGARATVGRLPQPSDMEPDAARVVVLSHAFWQSRYAGDSSLVGRTINLNGNSVEVVGVLEPGADFAWPSTGSDVWLPLPNSPANIANRGFYNYFAVARLPDGGTLEGAQASLDAVAARLRANYDDNTGRSFRAEPLKGAVFGETRTVVLALFGAAGCVLLIAALNLVGLLLARHLLRQGEFAVRTALGATRGRLARQLGVEVLVITLIGAGLGLALASAGLDLVRALGWPDARLVSDLSLDGRMLVFALALALVAGLACAFGAAMATPQLRLGALHGGRGTPGLAAGRGRRLLVVGETAMAFVLLVGAGLMLATVSASLKSDTRFEPRGLLAVRVAPPMARFTGLPDAAAYYDRLAGELATIPGVSSVAVTSQVPLSGDRSGTSFFTPGMRFERNQSPPRVNWQIVAPGFFRTMGIDIVRGRDFEQADRASEQHRVIINERVAEQFFGTDDPIGRMIRLGGDSTHFHEVIGVARAIRHHGLVADPLLGVYDLYGQHGGYSMALVFRTELPQASLVPALRARLAQFDPDAPLYAVGSVEEMARQTVADKSTVLALLAVFAGIAFTLAIIGVYGVMAQTVRAQMRSYGIRLALGAKQRQVLGSIMVSSASLALFGSAVGFCCAIVLTRALRGLLYGTHPVSVLIYGVVAIVLVLSILGASVGPARKAVSVDLTKTLRGD